LRVSWTSPATLTWVSGWFRGGHRPAKRPATNRSAMAVAMSATPIVVGRRARRPADGTVPTRGLGRKRSWRSGSTWTEAERVSCNRVEPRASSGGLSRSKANPWSLGAPGAGDAGQAFVYHDRGRSDPGQKAGWHSGLHPKVPRRTVADLRFRFSGEYTGFAVWCADGDMASGVRFGVSRGQASPGTQAAAVGAPTGRVGGRNFPWGGAWHFASAVAIGWRNQLAVKYTRSSTQKTGAGWGKSCLSTTAARLAPAVGRQPTTSSLGVARFMFRAGLPRR